jgi:hypothetical protein
MCGGLFHGVRKYIENLSENSFSEKAYEIAYNSAASVNWWDPNMGNRINKLPKELIQIIWNQERYFCIGNDGNGIVTVRFTMRNENIRIFGARYWREGRDKYEQKKNNVR